MVRSNGGLQNEKSTNWTPTFCMGSLCHFVLKNKSMREVSYWGVLVYYPHHWCSCSPVTPKAVSHNDSVNSMVQSIGQCVCTWHIFLTYLRLQTKPLFWLKAAFYKLNDFSPLLGQENLFFLPFSFNIPESCTWLFHDTLRREAVRFQSPTGNY